MNILITGGMGFVGSHLSEQLIKEKFNVTCLDIFEDKSVSYLKDFNNYNLVIDTILNRDIVKSLVAKNDLIIHLAAIAEPEQYVKYPRKTIEVNLRASLNIIDNLVATDKKIFFTSTSEIYGKNPNMPFDENSDRVLGSTNVKRWSYSTSKSMIEHYLYSLSHENLINFDGIRIFNCYGPRLKGRVISKFIDNILYKKPLEIHGDGTQKRCYTYIDDVVSAIKKIISNEKFSNNFYNVGNPEEEYSVIEIFNILKEILPNEIINYNLLDRKHYGKSYEDPERRVPKINLIKEKYGWTPKVSIREGLLNNFEFRKQQLEVD